VVGKSRQVRKNNAVQKRGKKRGRLNLNLQILERKRDVGGEKGAWAGRGGLRAKRGFEQGVEGGRELLSWFFHPSTDLLQKIDTKAGMGSGADRQTLIPSKQW